MDNRWWPPTRGLWGMTRCGDVAEEGFMVKGDNNKRKKELFMSFQRYDYPIDSGKELANKKFKN